MVKAELTQRYYQHYLSLIAAAPAPEMASDLVTGPPEGGQVQDSQENRDQGETPPALEPDLAPIAELPVLNSKPTDSSGRAADQKAKTGNAKPGKAPRCFIATAAYGSPLAPEVLVLQNFRDEHLAPHRLGWRLVRLYYFFSPPLARMISRRKHWQTWTRGLLRPILLLLKKLGLTGK